MLVEKGDKYKFPVYGPQQFYFLSINILIMNYKRLFTLQCIEHYNMSLNRNPHLLLALIRRNNGGCNRHFFMIGKSLVIDLLEFI